MTRDQLEIWTIYDHPTDFPDAFVARKFIFDRPTDRVITSPSLNTLRDHFRRWGLSRLPRQEEDDVNIVETWL